MVGIISPPDLVQSPDWKLYIILYFFFGGIASGAYFTASLIEVFGRSQERDRALARVAYLLAFPLVCLCGLLLVIDLGRPERFWHMLIDTYTGHPSIRWGSPMSVGSWALTVFGVFTFISFIGALTESGVLRFAFLKHLDAIVRRRAIHVPFAIIGSIFGFFIAGYTGVLLSVSNQPIWSDTHLLGALFLASAASTGIAAIALALAIRRMTRSETLHRLERADSFAMVVELVLLAVFLLSIGTVGKSIYAGKYATWLYFGVILAGLVVPLALRLRPRLFGTFGTMIGALLVLAGGLLLRTIIVLAPQA
ncbi:MAG: hypothetical protein NVSMB6_15750 [Burkholderiaceae bacterium]